MKKGHRSSPEQEPGRITQTLAQMGFVDRDRMNLGITCVPTRSAVVKNPKNGHSVYFTLIDYPVNGLGLEYALCATAPQDRKQIDRQGTVADWEEPDQAIEFLKTGRRDQSKAKRYLRHMKIPGFAEFDKNHRRKWIEVMNNERFDAFFSFLGNVDFIDQHILGSQLEEFFRDRAQNNFVKEADDFAGILPQLRAGRQILHNLQQSLEMSVPLKEREPQEREKIERFFGLMSGVLTIEPQTGKTIPNNMQLTNIHFPQQVKIELFQTFWELFAQVPKSLQEQIYIEWYQLYFQSPNHIFCDPKSRTYWDFDQISQTDTGVMARNEVAITPSSNSVSVVANDITARIALSQPNESGFCRNKTTFTFPKDYTGLTPLLAVEEAPEGNRFLSQREALTLLPEELKQDALGDPDVMLGRVMLTYLQPEVAETFLSAMQYPQPRGDGYEENQQQRMMQAQVPVWATFYADRLLSSQAIEHWKQVVGQQ